MRVLRIGALAAACSLALAAPTAAQQNPTGTYEEELKLYEEFMMRPALFIRARGMVRFAKTHDPKALEVFMKRYQKPEDPGDHVRYLVAGICGEELDQDATADTWKQWMGRYGSAPDSWLWFWGLQVQGSAQGNDGVKEIALNRKLDEFVRAAAIESLTARQEKEALLALIPELLGYEAPAAGDATRNRKKKNKGEKGLAKVVILESCAAALVPCKGEIGQDAFTHAATAVIEELDEKKLPYRSKLVVARALAKTFDVEDLYLSAQPWKNILMGKTSAAQQSADGEGGTRTRDAQKGGISESRFMGIAGTGTKIAFVVDMSDSMLTPLTTEEKEQLKRPVTGSKRRGPMTGEGRKDPEPEPEPKKNDPLDPANLPWDRINSRFEAARECLKLALMGLNPKTEFCVIFFGTDAAPLIRGKGFMPASRGNIGLVINELDKITGGAQTAGRQYGTLRGNTNIHGGLLEAFRATSRSAIGAHEHVDPAGFVDGADTIFLLSDGAPSWDNFPAQDKREKDINTGDPETGEKKPDQDILNYYGPYAQYEHLTRDLLRMNLFRKAQIHTIGIGEAEPQLLRRIAEIGGGEFRSISKESRGKGTRPWACPPSPSFTADRQPQGVCPRPSASGQSPSASPPGARGRLRRPLRARGSRRSPPRSLLIARVPQGVCPRPLGLGAKPSASPPRGSRPASPSAARSRLTPLAPSFTADRQVRGGP
ncbi:MAG: hypothetical protein R3F62_13415 [Planctomycetota bacterium]